MPLTDSPRTPERFTVDQRYRDHPILPQSRRGYQERLHLRRLMALSAAKSSFQCDVVPTKTKEDHDESH